MVPDEEGEPRKPDRPHPGQPGEGVVRRTRQPSTPLAAVAERPGLLQGYGQAALVHCSQSYAHLIPVGVFLGACLWIPDPWRSWDG